jgi:hypothetical protein
VLPRTRRRRLPIALRWRLPLGLSALGTSRRLCRSRLLVAPLLESAFFVPSTIIRSASLLTALRFTARSFASLALARGLTWSAGAGLLVGFGELGRVFALEDVVPVLLDVVIDFGVGQ